MNTCVHQGCVLGYDNSTMALSVWDEDDQRQMYLHWTSYWGNVPGLVPQRDEPIELVYQVNPKGLSLIGGRPPLRA